MQPHSRGLLVCLINVFLTHAIALSKSHLSTKVTQQNASHALQLWAQFPPTLSKTASRDTCHKFMHIPKTGGTSIDSTNFHLAWPAYGSLMKNTYDRIMANGMLNKNSEGDVFDSSHASLLGYVPFLLLNLDKYRWIHVDPSAPALVSTCQDLHTPPYLDKVVDQYFRNACRTFCAVRDPLDRYISGYKMHSIGACDPRSFEVTAKIHLGILKQNPFIRDCHFTKQVLFVYGANSRGESNHTYCQDVIHTEALSTEFNVLMQRYGRPDVKLSAKKLMTESDCKLTRHDISASIKEAIYEHYKSDFEAFGYPRPA